MKSMLERVLHEETGSFAWTAVAIAVVAAAGATSYSAAQERASAREATQAQERIAEKQIAAVGEQEKQAQTTAQTKLRAAQARKSKTILTAPELEEVNVNQREALGV